MLIEALAQDARGHSMQAQDLRARAFAKPRPSPARSTASRSNGLPMRLAAGPGARSDLNGRYGWLRPGTHGRSGQGNRRTCATWCGRRCRSASRAAAESVALLPTCYPSTREQPRGALKLAAPPSAARSAPSSFAGLGQRLFATSSGDASLLDVRELLLG